MVDDLAQRGELTIAPSHKSDPAPFVFRTLGNVLPYFAAWMICAFAVTAIPIETLGK
jgi:hypothetical protein